MDEKNEPKKLSKTLENNSDTINNSIYPNLPITKNNKA